MDRLTRSEVLVDQTAARFMGSEVKIQDISDKLMHLILNGPTINSINKDTLRQLVRQLYEALQRYEELDMTPEAIEQQLTNFSSFLMEMTGGRMSKTNYTVQAMVSEANDYFESVCDECSDRQQLAEVEKELEKIKAERDEAVAQLILCAREGLGPCDLCRYGSVECDLMCAKCTKKCNCKGCIKSSNWEWRGAKDTNVTTKEEDQKND